MFYAHLFHYAAGFCCWGNIHQSYPFHLLPPISYLSTIFKHTSMASNKQRQRKIGYFLLWKLLQQLGQEQVFAQGIEKDQQGRPHFNAPQFDFNLSHSGDWVAVILVQRAHNESVAIDIEHPLRVRNFERLLHYYASETEIAWWQLQQKQDEAFYLTWCAREAILKAKGRGIGAISKVRFEPENSCFYPRGTKRATFFCTGIAFLFSLLCTREWHNITLFLLARKKRIFVATEGKIKVLSSD